MAEIEAFRVLVRRLEGKMLLEIAVKRPTALKVAITKILLPLRLGNRLNLSLWTDAQRPPCEWIVVSVAADDQLSLFTDWLDEYERDLELQREADGALELTRNALISLRRLSVVAELTPEKFHEIIHRPNPEEASALRLGMAPHMPEQIVVRDSAGRDAVGEAVRTTHRVTLPTPVDIVFSVEFVGLYSAHIRLRAQGGRVLKRNSLLYWGSRADFKKNFRFFSNALCKREALSCVVRETLDKKGKTVRFEWIDAG